MIKSRAVDIVLIGVMVLMVGVGTLWSTKVISNGFVVDRVKLIFDMPSIRDAIYQHQLDAIYIPYRLRLLVFNYSVYIYQIARNIANFCSIWNINDTILLANLYPGVLGLVSMVRNKERWWLWVIGIITGLLVIGINKMVDARAATIFILPCLGVLVIKGISRVNIKLYVLLLLVSLLLFT